MLPSAERVEKATATSPAAAAAAAQKTPGIAKSRNFNPKSQWQSESQSESSIPSRCLPTDHLRTFYHSQTGDIAV